MVGVDETFTLDVTYREMHSVLAYGPEDHVAMREVRATLLRAYRQDVLTLQDLTGRDLSTWLRV